MYPHHHDLPGHSHHSVASRRCGQRHHPDFSTSPDAPSGLRHRGRPHGRGHGRAQRGDVRTALLLLLAEQPMYGYQLMQAITERTSGAWRPSPGAVYPTLSQLEDENLIAIVAEGGRKLATLTETGQQHLRTHGDAMPDPFAEFIAHSDSGNDLRTALEELRYPTRQLAMGNPSQVQAAQRVLTETRRSLYLILAGNPTPENETTGQ
jgi:DNA-binding PadR family transcriptional regulator